MKILIHATDDSLFPDADPSSVVWPGPTPEIVAVQSILYASLATSLFAAFLAMLGKQWINRYIRNRGNSAADKSRDRQRKLDGLEKWKFHLAIESLPVILQFALLLLWSALSLYLWDISRTVAWVILSFTFLGVASYIFFTLAGMLHYNCPYRTPLSIVIHTPFVKTILRRLRPGVRKALQNLGLVLDSSRMENVPLANVHVGPPSDQEIPIDWGAYKTDVRCISWTLSHTTDIDVILSTALFAADTIWYPEITGALSPHILPNLLLKCLLGGRVIPGKLEYASAIGLALASVLSVQLCMEPERGDLQNLCHTIHNCTDQVSTSEPTLLPGVAILKFVSEIPERMQSGTVQEWRVFPGMSDHLPTAHKLCLSRMTLQTIWRWKRADTTTMFNLEGIESFCEGLMGNDDHTIPTLKVNCFLIMAISLGYQPPGIHALIVLDDECVVSLPLLLGLLIW